MTKPLSIKKTNLILFMMFGDLGLFMGTLISHQQAETANLTQQPKEKLLVSTEGSHDLEDQQQLQVSV